jgi:predicted ATP-dependent protease
LSELTIIPVKHVDEVLRIALVLEEKDPLIMELGEIKKAFVIDNKKFRNKPRSLPNLM